MAHRRMLCLLAILANLAGSADAVARGSRLFKSGPIQVTADGAWVWVANADNDSVARMETATDSVLEVPLPKAPSDLAAHHAPRGLSVKEDGSEVWVACHDSDRLYALDASGALLARIDLRWGSGPYSIALSRDQRRALVTLHRASALAVVDVEARAVTRVLAPVFWAPLGIAWTEDGASAWVTHLFADGEDPFLTRVDFSGDDPKVASRIIVKSTNPKQSSKLSAPANIAEGGYLTFRGHLAQVPGASGRNEIWIPTQYNNINEDVFTPDSTVQTTIRHLSLTTRTVPNTNNDKVILSAVHVHDPQASGSPYVGPGWNAGVSGPVDIAFSTNGETAYVLCEQSDDLVIVPASTPAVKPAAAAPLVEVPVGDRPVGLAVSPVADVAYVANALSRDVSVVDVATGRELRRIPVTPVTGEPLPPAVLQGARIFHSSADPRISANGKVACASCHPHGEHDGRTWDFDHLPGLHGPRSSMSLLGLGLTYGPRDPVTGLGQLHRSGDRDEVQDFEHNFQGVMMGGTGFLGASVKPELGPPNAGLSPELDALAEYVLSLEPLKRSPLRDPGGSLSEAAVRGATFFVGLDRGAHAADAGCAACHVPETGFVDFKFHDVGQRRASNEKELNVRAPRWSVNTPTLVGVWSTPPYDGVSSYASTILGVLLDAAKRAGTATPHGKPDGLTGRQLLDLAEFVSSIDGSLTAAEVRAARDTTPPRITRVEPASLTTVDIWFSETVDRTSAEDVRNWRIERSGGPAFPVTSARWDSKNGDRVTLATVLEACSGAEFRVVPAGPILDAAANASCGVANAIDLADASNVRPFVLGETLTITLGGSGYENITVSVHDAGMVGPGLSTWGHDAPWLFAVSGGPGLNTGFVRFDWRDRFAAATGVASKDEILDASFSLSPEWGDAQRIEIRRVLQAWSDPSAGGDWNSDPAGGPTWRDHAHPSARWNQPGAQALGGTGASVSDYGGTFDLAASVDASVVMQAINERVSFGGAKVTDALRFWFENPVVDYGYALRLTAVARTEVKFERSEEGLGEGGPILTITYRLGSAGACAGQPFHRGDADGTGIMDITDAVYVLQYLFTGGPAPGCLEAADAQNDGEVDVSDAVAVLLYLFATGAEPAPPGPPPAACGADPDAPGSRGDLGCASYSSC